MSRFASFILFGAVAFSLIYCGKSSDHDHADHVADAADSIGAALLKEVDKVHTEAMDKMGEVRRLRDDLQSQLESTTNLVEDQKKALESKIAALDSAYDGMMHWMHTFDPKADSLTTEAYEKYLKDELEKATKIKQDILDAIARAKE